MSVATDPTQGLVDLYCKELKLPGLRRASPALAREALSQGHSYTAFLSACLAQEVASRKEHRLASRLRLARFPANKTLEGFDFALLPSLPKAKVGSGCCPSLFG